MPTRGTLPDPGKLRCTRGVQAVRAGSTADDLSQLFAHGDVLERLPANQYGHEHSHRAEARAVHDPRQKRRTQHPEVTVNHHRDASAVHWSERNQVEQVQHEGELRDLDQVLDSQSESENEAGQRANRSEDRTGP